MSMDDDAALLVHVADKIQPAVLLTLLSALETGACQHYDQEITEAAGYIAQVGSAASDAYAGGLSEISAQVHDASAALVSAATSLGNAISRAQALSDNVRNGAARLANGGALG